MAARIDSRVAKLDAAFGRAEYLHGHPELLADYSRHLCVQVAGLLERSVQALFHDYATRSASPQVSSYVEHSLERVGNVDEERLLKLVGYFSDEWKKDMEEFLAEESGSALNSIIGNRNNIAHGRDSSLSFHSMARYYEMAKKTIWRLESMLE